MGKRTKNRALIRVTLSLNSNDYDAVVELAKQYDISVSRLVRQAVRDLLGRYNETPMEGLTISIGDQEEGSKDRGSLTMSKNIYAKRKN